MFVEIVPELVIIKFSLALPCIVLVLLVTTAPDSTTTIGFTGLLVFAFIIA